MHLPQVIQSGITGLTFTIPYEATHVKKLRKTKRKMMPKKFPFKKGICKRAKDISKI